MKIFDIIRNPLFKGVGILAILYFALFTNTENPSSLGNRLSAEKLKKNLDEVQDKSKFIMVNLNKAKELAKTKEVQQAPNVQTSIDDSEAGSGDQISCGDEAEIAYGIYTKEGKQLEFINSKKLIIGDKENAFLVKNIIGMRAGGIRIVNIPSNFETTDNKLAETLKFNATDLKYQIMLLSFTKAVNSTISCQ